MTKILFILPDLTGGGAEKVTLSIIEILNKQPGIQADLFIFCKRGEHLDKLPSSANLHFTYTKNLPFFYHYKVFKHLLNTSSNYDLVIGSLEIISIIYSSLISKLSSIPSIAWVHKNISNFYSLIPTKKRVPYHILMNWALNQASAIVGVSEGVSNALRAEYPSNKDKISTIYNPFSHKEILAKSNENIDNSLDFIFTKPTLLAVGRLAYQKNYPLLLKIHKAMLGFGFDHNLLILGEGEDRDILEIMIEDMKIEDSCFLPGFKNPYPYMKKSDLLIMTSHYEGLPTVLIEAMIIGTLLCSVDCESGPSEILDKGDCGLLLPSADKVDIDDAAKKIIALLNDNKKIKTIKDKMIMRTELFEAETSCENWLNIINKYTRISK